MVAISSSAIPADLVLLLSPFSHEDNLGDWIEHVERSTREADEKMMTHETVNWVETQKKLKWRQALRKATQSQERWTKKAAEWNAGLNKSTKTQKRAGRPAKRWEDDLNDFVKDEATEAIQSNGLKNDTAWFPAATNADDWKERQYVNHTASD